MKKFIMIVIASLMSIMAFGQNTLYQSTAFASGIRNEYTGNITWSDWEDSNIKMIIDWDRAHIDIYSPVPQSYLILSCGDSYKDAMGGTSIDCIAIDDDNLKCKIRFRIDPNNISQLYVFYNDVAWIYNIVKIR